MGGKTALQMRADMRSDLKDSGSLWSNAELSRCIERAVADLSRYLPDSRTYEFVLDFGVEDESVTFPTDTDADRVVDGADISATADGGTVTITAQPDVPRFLTMTVTDANGSITNMSVIVSGTDKDGKALQETLHYAKGMGVITGKKYFKTVNKVEVNQIDGNGAGDLLDIGIGAYTDVWVYLVNHPVKDGSETGTDAASNSLTRDTDYRIDYVGGRLKAISGGNISAGEACVFDYERIHIGVDLSILPDLIRVERCEYPVGRVPQSMVPCDTHGKLLFITGMGEYESQPTLSDGEHVRIYYDAEHIPPNDFAPGTIPEFLENTVTMAAEAYALLVYALKHEHQAGTDLGSMRDAIGYANTLHETVVSWFGSAEDLLDNGEATSAKGVMEDGALVTLRGLAADALAAAALSLADADSYVGLANTAKEGYMGSTANYVDGGTAPDIKKYLDDGDALINSITHGGENERTPEMYTQYAVAVKDALVAAHEQNRTFYIDQARIVTNAGLGFVQEAVQHVSSVRAYVEQSAEYNAIGANYLRGAEALIAEIAQYLTQAGGYGESAASELTLADQYRTEALDRRNEVLSIWHDRKQYIGDFTMGSVRQIPTGD